MYGIFTYIWLVFMVNVGIYQYIYIYTPYIDPMGLVCQLFFAGSVEGFGVPWEDE